MITDRRNRDYVPQTADTIEVVTTKHYGLSKPTYIGEALLVTDANGDTIPQLFDHDQKAFVPLTTKHFEFEEGS